MARGINRAEHFNKALVENKAFRREICVFISHQKADVSGAKLISEYIQDAGLDVYFDENDNDLRLYRQHNNPKGVVDSIKNGINKSTNMLCLYSKNTLTSKWVPFEIGYSSDKVSLAVLTLKNIDEADIPDYIKVSDKILRGTKSLNDYVAELSSSTTAIMESKQLIKSNNTLTHPLDQVLNWKL